MSEIKVISICDLELSDDFETSCMQVQEYCRINNAHYYAREREEFSRWEAINEALAWNKTSVVVEDLS